MVFGNTGGIIVLLGDIFYDSVRRLVYLFKRTSSRDQVANFAIGRLGVVKDQDL